MFCTSCGKELKEGAAFCTRCGKPVKENNTNVQTLQKEMTQETNQETNDNYNGQQSGEQQKQQTESSNYDNSGQSVNSNYNNGNNSQPQNMNNVYSNVRSNYGYTPMMNNGYQNYNQNYGQFNNRYNISPEQVYKRSVLPFKLVSAILNLISLGLLAMIGLVAVALGEDSFKEYKYSWVSGFKMYGYMTVLIGLVLFVFIILGFALPAKAGVAVNLITTIASTVLLVWGTLLYGRLLSQVNRYIHSIGYVYNEDVQAVTITFMVFGVMGIFFQIVSFILSCIGLTKRRITM